VGKIANHSESLTRQQLLQAALKSFADRGYAATSVQHIVDAAQVSKPALYYYFDDKAELFEALVNHAHDERYRLMQEAADRCRGVPEKLEAIVASVFAFSVENQPLMRLAFATAFAPSDEAPGQAKFREKGCRNYEFIRSIMDQGRKSGELDSRFSVDDLAMGFYGQLNTYVMVRLFMPDLPLNPQTAKRIVRLYLQGAEKKKKYGRQA
jgi:AcrR family transcriptional regulator